MTRSLIFLATLLIGCSAEREMEVTLLSDTDAMFRQVGTVPLDTTEFLSWTTFVDADADGRLVVTDQVNNHIYLYDRTGRLVTSLDPGPCYLDGGWRPHEASFSPDGQIFVSNNGPGVLFDRNGQCIEQLAGVESPPRRHRMLAETNIVGLYTLDQPYLRMINPRVGVAWDAGLGNEFVYLNRAWMGGGVAILGDYIAVGLVQDPFPQLFTLDGRRGPRLEASLPFFSRATQDLTRPNRDPQSMRTQLSTLRSSSSLVDGFFQIGNSRILGQSTNPDNTKGYWVIDLNDGEGSFASWATTGSMSIRAAKNGRIYVERTLDATYGNPVFDVYELVEYAD